MRLSYGTTCVIEFNPSDPDHVKRRGRAYTRPSGRTVIPNSFRQIVGKVSMRTSLKGSEPDQHSHAGNQASRTRRGSLADLLQGGIYFGSTEQNFVYDCLLSRVRQEPEVDRCRAWYVLLQIVIVPLMYYLHLRAEQFSTLCTVFADMSNVKKEKKERDGRTFYTLDFKIVLLCGLTELKAQIIWFENVS
jgi:hypothetical protein